MIETWPSLIKRTRFAYSLSQSQLGDILGVDQGTISRWERATTTPELDIQKRIRDMLRRHDPSLSVAGIARLPTVSALVYQDNISKIRAISKIAAAAYNMTPEEAIDKDFAYVLPASILRSYAEIMDHAAWRNCEAAGYETVLKRGDGQWYQCLGLIVGPSNIVTWNAAPTKPPPDARRAITAAKVITLDELVG